MTDNFQNIVIGAGLCGLASCLELEKKGESCLLLEQGSRIGGKLQTEIFESNYLLDSGFQVLLPAYSELRRVVNLDSLDLRTFHSGAKIWLNKEWITIADPLQNPQLLWKTLFARIGNLQDKLLVLKLKLSVLSQKDERFFEKSLGSSADYLKNYGFSSEMIENFWQPFFSGIFLESELKTEAAFLRFLFKMFSRCPVAVPAQGIGELPQILFSKLTNTTLRLNAQVAKAQRNWVELSNGEILKGRVFDARPPLTKTWGSVTTVYFSADQSPLAGPWLLLNSRRNKNLVNHIAVMSEVSRSYALQGDALISVNILQPQVSPRDHVQIRDELKAMFGPQVDRWRHLKTFEIRQALPLYLSLPESDPLHTPSQQGAFLRARRLSSFQT